MARSLGVGDVFPEYNAHLYSFELKEKVATGITYILAYLCEFVCIVQKQSLCETNGIWKIPCASHMSRDVCSSRRGL